MIKSNIVELNKDIEQFVIQATNSRSRLAFGGMFEDKYKPLCFVHCADMHNVATAWNRMVDYVNYYSDYISFAVHTGDFCGGSQREHTKLYEYGFKCVHPVYNCPGNHDCFAGWVNDWTKPAEKKSVHDLLFDHTEDWDVCFMDCEYSMSYYKDFEESNIRMIVLDDYYNIAETREWLKEILEDAKNKGFEVITAQHETMSPITNRLPVKYNFVDDYHAKWKKEIVTNASSFDAPGRQLFEDVIADFINNGGKFICNLAGHYHVDEIGYTDAGLLNVIVQNGTTWDGLGDMKRVMGTKSEDCFNVVSVDTDLGLLKIIRVGANVDHYMRKKTALCYDYKNKKVVSDI